MKRLLFTLLLTGSLAGCLSAWAEVTYLTTEQFQKLVFNYPKQQSDTSLVWKYEGRKPCVIDFYTTWCGPCKRLAPIMDSLSTVYKNEVVFYKVDTERERELAMLFQISSIPQVLYVPRNGKPMILKGLYPAESIVQIIDEFLLNKKQ